MGNAAFLTASWSDLVILNYVADPGLLERFAPSGTELDSHGGPHLVSVVGLRFVGTRVKGIAVPFHRDFEEVNLRLYVRRAAPEGMRRGVVFVKELVPRAAVAWTARRFYHERYSSLPMRHRIERPGSAGSTSVTYEWRVGRRWSRLAARTAGPAFSPPAGSEEAFIAEHEWGYVRRRDGTTLEYRVAHRPWKLWRAADAALDCDIAKLWGEEFVASLEALPHSAFMADGSAVVVHHGTPLA